MNGSWRGGFWINVYDCKLQQISCVNKMCFSFLGLLYFTITSMYNWVVVSKMFSFYPYLGKTPILTNIFQVG